MSKNIEFTMLDPSLIEEEPGFNYRSRDFNPEVPEDLSFADSIRERGVQETLRVWPNTNGKYTLGSGHRRLGAVKWLQANGTPIMTVPVIIDRRALNNQEKLLQSIVANALTPVDPLDEARAYRRLENYGMSQAQISKEVGKSAVIVSNRLQLLAAEPEVILAYEDGEVSATQVMNIVRESRQESVPQEVVLQEVVHKVKREKPILSIEEQYEADKIRLYKFLEEVQIEDVVNILAEFCEENGFDNLLPHLTNISDELNKNVVSM